MAEVLGRLACTSGLVQLHLLFGARASERERNEKKMIERGEGARERGSERPRARANERDKESARA
jgi:hypothetical protein